MIDTAAGVGGANQPNPDDGVRRGHQRAEARGCRDQRVVVILVGR
jgi:hypothetical protein